MKKSLFKSLFYYLSSFKKFGEKLYILYLNCSCNNFLKYIWSKQRKKFGKYKVRRYGILKFRKKQDIICLCIDKYCYIFVIFGIDFRNLYKFINSIMIKINCCVLKISLYCKEVIKKSFIFYIMNSLVLINFWKNYCIEIFCKYLFLNFCF